MTTRPDGDAIVRALQNDLSLPVPELLDRLRHAGSPMTEEEFEEAWRDQSSSALARIDIVDPELVVDVSRVLTGRVFTHRLDEQEVERGELSILPDLAGIWTLLDTAPFDQLDARPIKESIDPDTLDPVIRLSDGALDAYAVDSLVALSVGPDGLHLAAAVEPDDVIPRLTELLLVRQEVFANDQLIMDPDDPGLEDDEVVLGDVPLEEFLLLVCARDPQAFTTPGPLLSEILEEIGLEQEDGMVAVAGFDFAGAAEIADAESELERICETYDLSNGEAAAVLLVIDKVDELHDALHDWADDGENEDEFPEFDLMDLLPAMMMLAEPMVVVAIADEKLGGDPHLGTVLKSMLMLLQPEVPRRSMAGWHWLVARCDDLLSAFEDAEAGYRTALDLDADFYPAMRELASLASLRGDAAQAVSLLNRAMVPSDDAELAMVSRYVGETRADIGRNDVCWCGSGKKYKKCHLGRSDFDLAARRDWLYDKVANWVRNGPGRELVIELAATAVDPAVGPEALFVAVKDPLMIDVAMFEGGLLDEFIDTRATILPDDERELLVDWQTSRRSLATVTGLGTGCIIEDLDSGAVVTLPLAPVGATVGDLVCVRLLAAGPTLAAPGGSVLVPPSRRALTEALLALQGSDEEDPIRTVSVLSGRSTD
ncbi:hypothetical protein ABIB25_001608 [Nakamurella sp. UYEF19]|uniref:SEC-C domain-containing protein n=1 Tax=Nakamurella sp. UYEF19 TaxID=1756392 RepID=UPI00339B0CDC